MKTATIFTLLFLVSILKTGAQTANPDSLQTDRLAKLCQLWGHVHFFHPYLAYKDLPWDSAFAEAVPQAIAAKDSAAYAGVLSNLLSSLGDPLTQVVRAQNAASAAFSTGEKHPLWHFTEDSNLVVTIRNYHDLTDWNYGVEKFSKIAEMLPAARGVLFDWRTDVPNPDAFWTVDYAFSETGFGSKLADIPLVTPGKRARMYDGFAPEDGGTSGGYYSAFYTTNGQQIQPAPGAKSIPVVFLINENSSLLPVAMALQAAGKGGSDTEG